MAAQSSKLTFKDWDQPEVEGTPPCPRVGHASTVVGQRLYMFGGSAASEEDEMSVYLNDMFFLDFEQKLPRWEKVEQNGDIPSPRDGHTLNAIGKDLFLYGGVADDNAESCLEGVYIFSIDTSTWARKDCSGPSPLTSSLSTAVSGRKLYTFGGVLNGVAQNNVHSLDTESFSWTLLETTGTCPTPRCDHASVVVGGRLYIACGSAGPSNWLNDLHYLNLDTLEWKKVAVKGKLPPARDYPSLCNVCNWFLLLFGGYTGTDGKERGLSDVHVIDLTCSDPVWVPVAIGNSPGGRYNHTARIVQKKLVVFGGSNLDQELGDLWITEAVVPTAGFEPSPVPRSKYTHSMPIPAPRKVVQPTSIKEVKPRDFLELRGSYVKSINDIFDLMAEKFCELDTANETLLSERTAFEAEKKDHSELYEKQQQELKEMFEAHKRDNEQWLEQKTSEINTEKLSLAEERARLEKASAELSKEKELLEEKSKKFNAIMQQMHGLSS